MDLHLAVEAIFNDCFARTYRTKLSGGAAEPVYTPAALYTGWHQICYREQNVHSALHEVAHWCIAGSLRRQQLDYGYWYAADGRDEQLQSQFEEQEARPQALEWMFSEALGVPFYPSADNLLGHQGPSAVFLQNLMSRGQEWARQWAHAATRKRHHVFVQGLVRFSGRQQEFDLFRRQLELGLTAVPS